MSYLILLVIQILLSFVGRGFTINNASKEKIEPFYETAADEGEVGGGGGGGADKNGMSNFIFSSPTFHFALLRLTDKILLERERRVLTEMKQNIC